MKEILKDFNGQFLNTVINFLINGSVIFLVLRQATNLQRKPSAAPVAPTTKDWAFCCTPIPVAAERCPNCTSQLQSLEAAAQ